ncbi:unnamed protein product [Cylicocyclus nassatus]|uniref:Uncharacterized protein n=1 Tax=Cylicocyclus nassatus TaxID=53992 RepID=A0AA36DTB1_CYLNA|nr:unnamed protein product [Cylicocyclus nassatus]
MKDKHSPPLFAPIGIFASVSTPIIKDNPQQHTAHFDGDITFDHLSLLSLHHHAIFATLLVCISASDITRIAPVQADTSLVCIRSYQDVTNTLRGYRVLPDRSIFVVPLLCTRVAQSRAICQPTPAESQAMEAFCFIHSSCH